jgi:internalin A
MAVDSVTTLWTRIRTWLETRVPKACLASPAASESQIRKAEKDLGHRLPDDLREFYKIHNGLPGLEFVPANNIGILLPLVRPRKRSVHLGCQCVVDVWAFCKEILESGVYDEQEIKPKGPIAKVVWTPDWIPIFDNIQGDYLFLDMNPPRRGTVGQIIDWTRGFGPTRVVAKSFHAFLDRLANDMERNLYVVEMSTSMATVMKKSQWKKYHGSAANV